MADNVVPFRRLKRPRRSTALMLVPIIGMIAGLVYELTADGFHLRSWEYEAFVFVAGLALAIFLIKKTGA